MRFVYGTGNRAKVDYLRKVLQGLNIEIVGLADGGLEPLEVPECGADPLENARIKARAYFEAYGLPVFSCDSGLFLEGLPDARQPGINVRTVGGRRLSDEEMIAHYGALARELGGRARARYRNAICLIAGGSLFAHDGEDIASEPFLLCAEPHPRRNDGFPLDSLSVEIRSGRYYYDLNQHGHIDTDHSQEDGFRAFFRRVLVELEAPVASIRE